jgi:hypothetical protein
VAEEADIAGQPHKNFCHLKPQSLC